MRKALLALGVVVVVLLGLVAWPAPRFAPSVTRIPPEPSPVVPAAARSLGFILRDGARLAARSFGADDAPVTIVFLHGILSSSLSALPACAVLQTMTGARVVALDLRGHGRSDGARGDIAHLDQYEEDLQDVAAALRRDHPATRLVLAGHSMGGGIVLRYAEKKRAPAADGYLLFSPLLGPRSPTMTEMPTSTAESPVALALPRTIGLGILNLLHLRALNGLPTLVFNTDGPLHAYSFRAMDSMAPHDYAASMTADALPMLVLVGSHDEVFVAARFAAIVARHAHGETRIIDGESHNGVLGSLPALGYARDWLRTEVMQHAQPGAASPPPLSPSVAPVLR